MADTLKSKLHIETFSSFNNEKKNKEISFHETFNNSDNWIKWGKDNLFPQQINELSINSSGLHSALLKRKADMVAGLGFETPTNFELENFIRNKFGKETLNKIVYKCAADFVTLGSFSLNLVWSEMGNEIAKVFFVPAEKVRVEKPDEEENINNYYISRDWNNYKKSPNEPKPITAFNYDVREEFPNQILFVTNTSNGMDYYSTPSYLGCLNYIQLSKEISIYQLNGARKGYYPNMLITIPVMSDSKEENDKIAKEIRDKIGVENANETVVFMSSNKDEVPVFTPINPTTSEKKFLDNIEVINQEIYIGHSANPTVAGIAVSGKLGNTNEVKEQFEIFQKTVINPLQQILEEEFNKLAELSGIDLTKEKLKLKKYTSLFNE